MTAVTPVTSQAAALSAAPAATAQGGMIGSDFQTFLQMLTVQMRHQDPLNPMQASDFAVQLATFSGVEQQLRTNQLLEGLTAQMGVAGLADFAGWVGMEARAEMPAAFTGEPIRLAPPILAIAERAELVVRNAFGTEVARRDIPLEAGDYLWDGTGNDGLPLPEGTYSFEVVNYAEGEPVAALAAEVWAVVAEARLQDGTAYLVLPGGVQIAAAAVTALRPPG